MWIATTPMAEYQI